MNKLRCSIIFFHVAGKRKYVAELPIRPDNRIVPIYSDDISDAHLFEDENDAKEKLARFINLNNRMYQIMPHEVLLSKRDPTKLQGGAIL